jgi:hypothetical protein
MATQQPRLGLGPEGRARRLEANLSGAIYGVITATAVMTATSGHGGTAWTVLAGTTITLVVFWLAHVYAEVLAHHLGGHHRPSFQLVNRVAMAELPLVTAPAPSLILLALGVIGLLSDPTAIDLALGMGVLQLVGWAFAYARQQGWPWLASIGIGAVNGTFGVAIIALKTLVH